VREFGPVHHREGTVKIVLGFKRVAVLYPCVRVTVNNPVQIRPVSHSQLASCGLQKSSPDVRPSALGHTKKATISRISYADSYTALARALKDKNLTDPEVDEAIRLAQWAREELNLRPHAYQACALTN
jgi:hypothetical protein